MARQRGDNPSDKLLGAHPCVLEDFPNLSESIVGFHSPDFSKLGRRERWQRLCGKLLQLIQQSPAEIFLLKAVINYLDAVNRAKLFDEPLTLPQFEFWLNHFSGLDQERNYLVRSQIAGKFIPREDYGGLFPIGVNKVYPGSHFVAAHLSPDVDTTVASFWGWMDAFASRVAEGQHIWSLPGGITDSQLTLLFHTLFGEGIFRCVPRLATSLTLSAMDLLTQSNIIKAQGSSLASELDHGPDNNAILYVDGSGHYIGDWRGGNFEPVRQIIVLFNACLRWFENNLHGQLIALFAKERLQRSDLKPFLDAVLNIPIADCEPAQDFTTRQCQLLDVLMQKVLALPEGLKTHFGTLLDSLAVSPLDDVGLFLKAVRALETSELFDAQGVLKEQRPSIFHELLLLFRKLAKAIHAIRNYVDRLDMVMRIKHDVLGYRPHFAILHSDVEELRFKMRQRDYLTVVFPDDGDKLYPIGVIPAWSLRREVLGTVSQRDFCNPEEIRMASYLEVISVIDHHKTSLKTGSAPQAIIGDAQSSNVLVAEQAFAINDRYSTGGMPLQAIEEQVAAASLSASSADTRVLRRLLQRRMAAMTRAAFFIDPRREYAEYLCFLTAILDDTDLLTKVTKRDALCVASLLNRLKSLAVGRELEIVHFDDLPQDRSFARLAAQRLLQNADLYSLYKKTYAAREQEIDRNLAEAVKGHPAHLFSDTKEQNACCRIGQMKLFLSNRSTYAKYAPQLRSIWLEGAQAAVHNHPEIDLHLQMASTVASADEVYEGNIAPYPHQDELWFWVAPTQAALDHLGSFLSGFQTAPEIIHNDLSLELQGPNTSRLEEAFARNFCKTKKVEANHSDLSSPVAILRYRAGSINSRKALITPYLPHLV